MNFTRHVFLFFIHFSISKYFLELKSIKKEMGGKTGSAEAQPTMTERPIGPLITKLGMELSFVSQHLEKRNK